MSIIRNPENDGIFENGTNSVPPLKETLRRLLDGEVLSHQDIIKSHNGKCHRSALVIQRLRDKYKFGSLIQCPRYEHPLRYHYFIMPSDMSEAWKLAIKQNLILKD